MKKLFSILLITCYLLFITASVANAVPLVPCGGEGNPCKVCHFFVLAKNIFDFLVEKIALPIAVVVFIYGGIMLLTSGGSEDKITKGRKALWQAVWGMLIAFAAWIIVDTIIKWLVDPNFQWQFGPWNKIPPCP